MVNSWHDAALHNTFLLLRWREYRNLSSRGEGVLTTTRYVPTWKETAMQLQMRLNMLVMLASFALVGAIVLGMI